SRLRGQKGTTWLQEEKRKRAQRGRAWPSAVAGLVEQQAGLENGQPLCWSEQVPPCPGSFCLHQLLSVCKGQPGANSLGHPCSSSKQFNDEVLKAHNEYRRQHGVPPLKLCKKLNREAQQYSEALASTRILKHSPESSRGQCGENLAWASYDQTGKEVADRWYSEIKNYNFQQPGFTSGTGHFTAMVWKNTKKMGVGKASASDGSSFVVARYFPAGNVVNQGFFEENVLPPKK
uniref:Golgi-associated plant pathogenesis-related protein 1 n=1 Tax=Equus caballus TaxID=9796 RepID=A0A9L0RLJ1_HORSE